jgi:hypothetical protein
MPEKMLERNRKSRRAMKPGARRDGWTELDTSLRLLIYRHLIAKCRAPSMAEMASQFKSQKHLDVALQRLCASHAFVLQENGELWRAAPFSAVPTAFPVRVGNRSYYGNCIWDALGIPAMLAQDARIDASCCCNLEMLLKVENGRLLGTRVRIYISLPEDDSPGRNRLQDVSARRFAKSVKSRQPPFRYLPSGISAHCAMHDASSTTSRNQPGCSGTSPPAERTTKTAASRYKGPVK